jgi:hypothetical protein
MADVNFVDGQALEPYYFGSNDANGTWSPIPYYGTYGINGYYLPFSGARTPSFAGSFNGSSQSLSVPNVAGLNPTGDFTLEFWLNPTNFTSLQMYLTKGLGIQVFTNASSSLSIALSASNNSTYFLNTAVGTLTAGVWSHIALVRSRDTYYVFINGIMTYTVDIASTMNTGTDPLLIGRLTGGTPYYANAQMSNVRFVNGTALYTDNFTPSTSPLTAIPGTQLLTLQSSTIIDNSPNAAVITNTGTVATATAYPFGATIASDYSGNANNWSPVNFQLVTPGATTYSSMIDVPAGASGPSGTQPVSNYPVMNPLAPALVPLGANLIISQSSAAWISTGSTIYPSTGKWYVEATATVLSGTQYIGIGLRPIGQIGGGEFAGSIAGSYGGILGPGQINPYSGGVLGTVLTGTYTGSTPIRMAVDFDAGKVWFGSFNGWCGGGDPAAGTSPTYTFTPNTQFNIYFSAYANNCFANFGQRPWTYTPPSGFRALCTANLPVSTIKQGNQYMDALLWTGNGTSPRTISGYNFSPDFIWTKSMSVPTTGTSAHYLYDTVRGAGSNSLLTLEANSTAAEFDSRGTQGNATDITSNGITFTSGSTANSNRNENNVTYVAWAWDAGSSTVTNTSGSISSQVRANPTAGFSIVTYTGTSANATVGHGLGVAPKMIIFKNRLSGTTWVTYHASISPTNFLQLNTTDSIISSATFAPFGSTPTAPTSSVFYVGNNVNTNNSGIGIVAYCFSEIAGFSKFGSYTGNGSADGTFVYTGFRPKFVMLKSSSRAESWILVDTSRAPFNEARARLFPNLTNAETSSDNMMDILSNGFKMRNVGFGGNESGATYIYMAFAENPFAQANAR